MDEATYRRLVTANNRVDDRRRERTRALQFFCLGQVTNEELEATRLACLEAEKAVDAVLGDCS